jgi:hypothetical protein
MKITARSLAVLVAAAAVGLSGCGGVDRAGTKKNILKSFEGSGIAKEDQTCVANLIDNYSDSDIKKIDSAFKVSATDPTDPAAKKFLGEVQGCVVKSTRQAVIDEFVKAKPDMTDVQKKCLTDYLAAKSASDFAGDAAAMGAEIAKTCLT